jgi:hypothetical protein
MGRVNILYSLLNKDIRTPRMGAWINNVISKTWFDKGNVTFSYVALLSMFAKAKKLSYQDFVASLIFKIKKGKSWRLLTKRF